MLETHFIPAAAPGGRRLMMVLHGLGDSMEGWTWVPEAMQLPWLNYLLVNAPDPYYGGFSWYDINTGAGVDRSCQLLFQLLDSLKEYPADQIILSGFSQGCLMSVEVGVRYPRRLAGIVGISGYVHQPEKLAQELSPVALQQRFLLTHGTQDPLIAIELTRKHVAVLRQAGVKIDWHEFVKAHNLAGEKELAVIRQFIGDCYEQGAKI